MRGLESGQVQLFYQINVEEMIPAGHPLRVIRALADGILEDLSPKLDGLYGEGGKPSIPPERLLRAWLLQKLYTIRSDRQMEEHLHYNFLYRWFVGLQPDEKPWDHSTVSKNQARLVEGDIAREFLQAVVHLADETNLLSNEHFTVDGTLLEAAASLKSFKPRKNPRPPKDDDPGNPTVNFRKEKRRNDTHVSTTDPEARLFKKGKGKEAKLYFIGHKGYPISQKKRKRIEETFGWDKDIGGLRRLKHLGIKMADF